MAACALILYIAAYTMPIMTETNDKSTIANLEARLEKQDTRIASLEKELADLKTRQFPSFITQSTFVLKPV